MLVTLLALAACGGSGGPDPYQEAVSVANKKELDARTAGTASPCMAAAASAAAAEQNVLARQALVLAPPSNFVCTAVVPPVPVLRCVANSCGV